MPTLLLVALTAIYFLRPADWVPGAASVPFFQIVIIPCVILTIENWTQKLNPVSIRENPITRCVLGLFFVALTSQVINAPSEIATTIGFSKACIFYLLLVSILDSKEKQRAYLKALAWIIFILAVLMILGQNGPVRALKADRAEALGGKNFDPNDTAAILVIGILTCGHFAISGQGILWQILWACDAAFIAVGLRLTDSRGGFLALGVGLVTYITARWGKRGLLLGAGALPVLAALLATNRTFEANAVSQGTGQARVQLWHDGIVIFEHHPLLGIGPDQFTNVAGKACHNSFVQSYADLGFFGGTLFVGAFWFALNGVFQTLNHIRRANIHDNDSIIPLIMSLSSGYAMAIFALNHLYSAGTYLVLGLSTAVFSSYRECENYTPGFQQDFVRQLTVASFGFLISIYCAAKLLVNWG